MTETAFPDEKLWNRPFCHCTAPTIMANVPKRQDFRKSWYLMPLSRPSKLNCTEASAQTLLLLAWLSIWDIKHRFSGSLCQTQLPDQPSRTSLRISDLGCRISHINQIACSTVQFQDDMSKRSSEWKTHFWGSSVPFWKVLFLPKILSGCKLLKNG